MIKTVVTGGHGYIGSHLIKKIGGCWSPVHSDIVHGHSYECDQLFFLSTYGNMAHHTDYRMMVKANVQGVLTMLNGFSGWFCYMSSSSVTLPVQTPYSRTKRAAEEILQSLPELKACIVRPYSVTGVGEQKEHLIPTLIRSCMEGEEMQFDPNPVHDYVNVEDVVGGLIALSEEQTTGIVEFGNGVPITNQKVCEIVEWVCSRRANVKEILGLRSYDNQEWYCRSTHPIWKPKKSLYQSIEEMVEVYRNQHQ